MARAACARAPQSSNTAKSSRWNESTRGRVCLLMATTSGSLASLTMAASGALRPCYFRSLTTFWVSPPPNIGRYSPEGDGSPSSSYFAFILALWAMYSSRFATDLPDHSHQNHLVILLAGLRWPGHTLAEPLRHILLKRNARSALTPML